MTDSNLKQRNPIQSGQKTIDDLFKLNDNKLSTQNLMSEVTIAYDTSEYNLPNQNKFFHSYKGKIYLCRKSKKSTINLRTATTFVVVSVKECFFMFNDKSDKKPVKHYLVTLKNANGVIEEDIEIANNSKSDFKQFQTVLNEIANGFLMNMAESEYKAFVEEFISPNVAEKVKVYSNAGLTPDGNILYANALATSQGIIWADKDGYIKIGDKQFVKVAESKHYLPKLAKSVRTGQQIAFELMQNIKECWSDNIIAPLLILGNMAMSIYFDDFVKRYGVPTLIIYGDSGSGKSTLVVAGLALFGLSKEALTSGGSTAKSNEYFSSHYSCLNIGIDDVKADTLASQNFIALIKGAYKGVARTRMLPYGKGVEYINVCSPLTYSTNESLPNLKEVINRLNVIEIFGNGFKADKFKYHEFDKNNENKLNELSLILPEFLKYSKESVINMYEKVFEILENNVKDTQKRIINNIAYAYTGALMLSYISGVEFENLQEKVIEFAQKQVEKYDSIKTPVEKVLAGIIVLTRLHQLANEYHYRIFNVEYEDTVETHIRFNKELVISAINKYYTHDKSMRIDENSFLSYAKNHPRYRGNNHGVRYANDTSRVIGSICFDITGMTEFVDISSQGVIMPTSAYQLMNNLTKNGNSM